MTRIHVGFTGTQQGMTEDQRLMLTSELFEADSASGAVTFHHGDCVGADSQAHAIAVTMGLGIVIHPPKNDTKRAYCRQGNSVVLPPKEYLERNHDIVDMSKVLIACPRGPETLRSGTWATVRYARITGIHTVIIYPDGEVVRDEVR